MAKLSTVGLYLHTQKFSTAISLLTRKWNSAPLMLLLGCGLLVLLCLDTNTSRIIGLSNSIFSLSLSSPAVASPSITHDKLSIAVQTWHNELQGAGRQLPRRAE